MYHLQIKHMNISFIILRLTFSNYSCTIDSFGGSTLQVMGTISGANGEWAIVGGTGKLSMARGTIKFTKVQPESNPNTENYRKIDIHAFYTPSPAVSIVTL